MCALMQQIVEDPLMRHSAILVFANKQDLVCPLAFASCVHCCALAEEDLCQLAKPVRMCAKRPLC